MPLNPPNWTSKFQIICLKRCFLYELILLPVVQDGTEKKEKTCPHSTRVQKRQLALTSLNNNHAHCWHAAWSGMFQPREFPAMPAGYYKLLTQLWNQVKRKIKRQNSYLPLAPNTTWNLHKTACRKGREFGKGNSLNIQSHLCICEEKKQRNAPMNFKNRAV